MKFAMNGVGTGSTARPEALKQVAQKAEALGFESIWVPEHLVVPVDMKTPYPYSEDGKFPGGPTAALHDPLLALAFVAGCTERIKLGTGVFVLPLRNPLAVAKAVASLDVLSSGRFLFGIGIGWLEEEFDAVGMPFKDRAARTREFVRMMKVLWSEETPRFAGRFVSFGKLGFNPKPAQKPYPPLIFGGETRVALKRAAEIGDGWYGTRFTPEGIAPMIAQLKEFATAAGRDFSRFEITCGIGGHLPFNRDTVCRFADVGVHRLMVFAPGFVPRSKFESDLFPQMERFADEVIARA
ncbi:MAG TPA: LLM class F420-dependent oxidoreductase [Candidatus Kryptonia bacterium]|nr:LLM class F420-dependent oxidoreductase [Candidatus Kryptonia bacterium]